MSAPPLRLEADRAPFLAAAECRAVMKALTLAPGDARYVGGCVRNALLGRKVADIDIATRHAPSRAVELLEAEGIRVVPTGLAHGTVTAVIGGRSIEITSLRRDVSTDGRRAVIAPTEDYAEDARRRDVTINALYADSDGTIHDPVGGLEDLRAGRVRFIGEARIRIREDFLRILRFFRIHAAYGRGPLDAEGLAAAAAERAGLARLSGDRLAAELGKLLTAQGVLEALGAMAGAGILGAILEGPPDLARLAHLVLLEEAARLPADPWRRLGALLGAEPARLEAAARRLRLPNAVRDRLLAMGAREPELAADGPVAAINRLLYREGAEAVLDRLLLAAAADLDERHAQGWRDRLAAAQAFTRPVFPLSGSDLLDLGIAPGPALGRLLAALEEAWIASGFALGRADLLARARRALPAGDP